MSITDSNSVAIDDSVVLEYYPSRGTIVIGVATKVADKADATDGNETIQYRKKRLIEHVSNIKEKQKIGKDKKRGK